MNQNEPHLKAHDWLIEILVDMVIYADLNGLESVSEELTNATLSVSRLLNRPVIMPGAIAYFPPDYGVVIPFRGKRNTSPEGDGW